MISLENGDTASVDDLSLINDDIGRFLKFDYLITPSEVYPTFRSHSQVISFIAGILLDCNRKYCSEVIPFESNW